jgi:hypothetical protein
MSDRNRHIFSRIVQNEYIKIWDKSNGYLVCVQHSWTSGQTSPRITVTNKHPDSKFPGVEPNVPRLPLTIGLYAYFSSYISIQSQGLTDQIDDSGASRAAWRS